MLRTRSIRVRAAFFAVALAFALRPGSAAALPACGITNANQLVLFDTDRPDVVQTMAVTGLAPGEAIVGIDVRSTNGRLYAVTDQERLYTLSTATGAAIQVGTGTFAIALDGTAFDIDFDPIADELRVTSNTSQNFRVDPDTGLAIDGGAAPGVQPDTAFNPGAPQIVGAAYRPVFAELSAPELFVLDAATDQLLIAEEANSGTVFLIDDLDFDLGTVASFDIAGEWYAYIAVTAMGSTTLYEKTMFNTPAPAKNLGPIGDGTLSLRALAVFPPQVLFSAVTTDNLLVTFTNVRPDLILSSNPITGLRPGESVLAIDYRPGTSRLYALGSTSRLYTVAANGKATDVGLAPFAVPLDGTRFGMDFDPVTDRLRIVSDTKQNLRVHPDTGKVIDGDPDTDGVQPDKALVGGNPEKQVVAIAYTDSAAGATESTLLGIEADEHRLVRIGGVNGVPPADTGTTTDLGPLEADAAAITGFDAAPLGFAGGNVAFAVADLGNQARLRRVTPDGFAVFFAPVFDHRVVALAIQPAGVVQFNQTHVYTTEGANVALGVARESGSAPVSVEYRVTGGTATNGAGEDYVLANGVVTLESGVLIAEIDLPILQDPDDEVGETILITLENISPGATLGERQTITVTIADDDGPANAPPSITILHPEIQVFRSMDGTVSLSGLATDDQGVVAVTWVNAGNKAAGVATGTTAWSVEGVPLIAPTQFITVTAVDAQGAIDTATVEVRAFEGEYFLPEGATGGFFDLDLLLANPTGGEAPVEITFLRSDGTSVPHALVLPPASRTVVAVDEIPGLENAEVSIIVESTSDLPIVVERTMRWDASGYGAHTEKATQAFKGPTWYFAEGAQGFFQTYFLLQAPGATATATLSAFTEDGAEVFSQDFVVTGGSRRTIFAGDIPALVDRAFWTRVSFGENDFGLAERAMYFGDPVFNAGSVSGGVNVPSTIWMHAEGATGSFFTTFLLLANPNDTEAHVDVTYLPAGGEPVTVAHVLAPRARTSINVALEDPSLADAAVAARVQSDLPILSERSMFWPGEPAGWYEAHSSFGVTATGTKWGLAEGRVGGDAEYQTYILLANPGDSPATVTIDYLRENGTIVEKQYTVPAESRYNVFVNAAVPELTNEGFGALIESSSPIFVERAMYGNAGGVVWASGTNATATRLP